ncbi:unnamed protein product [Tuber melanosporum]|uniref:(Perigord truffle) hypothetical protein n=1 Tax=Tuber melanosporum (strain Mel28) TaxID=656061 RepID=D5GMG4_TUBMM|nr:uncharacterized protein GSTUM_00010693001 [Tuber melanosporum]CAZ85707.1 unnamed protein product [Tuber melanosporum]
MDQSNKTHRKPKEKKKFTGQNPKAFAFANPGKLQKQATRSHDVREKRLHVPMVDRLPEEPPPLIVAVVGPPGVGKTTLVKSLVKRYTKHTLSSIQGPITVVTSKKRRLTFLECDNSLTSMIDISKIADIVLLLIDGNFGFEMETMEFLNVIATHGLPSNIFGILTHLDLFRSQSLLRTTKKRLKHRFWSELYQGAKLFYLSGVINGRYPDREIHNLSRFISVMKNPRPLVWRNSHYYMLADRMVDLTEPVAIEDDPKADRKVALYGYVRGLSFPNEGARVHIPGVGDLSVSSVESLPDPCPTPARTASEGKGRKRLGEKQKLIYAPMSDVGGVLVDKDAVYIDVPSQNFEEGVEAQGVGERLVIGLQKGRRGEVDGVRLFTGGEVLKQVQDDGEENGDVGRKHKRSVRALQSSKEDTGVEGYSDEDEDEEMGDADIASGSEDDDASDNGGITLKSFKLGKALRGDQDQGDAGDDITFAESDSDLGSVSVVSDQEFDEDDLPSDEDEDDDDVPRWKQDLSDNAKQLWTKSHRTVNLSKLIYDESLTPTEVIQKWRGMQGQKSQEKPKNTSDGSDSEEDFFKKVEEEVDDEHDSKPPSKKIADRGLPVYDMEKLENYWSEEFALEDLRRRFITANLLEEKERAEGEDGEFAGIDDSGDEGDGAFEDLETGEVHGGGVDEGGRNESKEDGEETSLEKEREKNARRKEELRLRFEEEDREGVNNDRTGGGRDGGGFGEDDWYDAQKAKFAKQLAVNQSEFEQLDDATRVKVEGHRAGTYARVVLSNVPYEFVAHFDPKYPILVGGLTATEDRFGFLQVRIKRHRWHKKILKTNDPLIFSLGWRRFQSIPIYSTSDSRTRNRMLKYTPEHMHCFGTFYGPLIAPNTGFCAVQCLSSKNPGFRVSATGVVLSVDQSTEIVKKLKLTGTPYKIFKNTAFIKDMFNSSLEVAKFEGASIRTVSGVRGQIKRALANAKQDGHFRATFEDKVLMSDIIFLRAWYPIKPRKFYNPVTNLLADTTLPDAPAWNGMRTTGEVRRELNIKTPTIADSTYKPIERSTRRFNPLRVPKAIQKDLPFASQIHQMKPRKRATYLASRAVVVSSEERKARDLVNKIATLKKEKEAKRREAKEKKREVYRKKVAENTEMKAAREKRERDEYWAKEGKKRRNTENAGGGGRGKRRRGGGD